MAIDGDEGALAGARAGCGTDVRGAARRGSVHALRWEGGVVGWSPAVSHAERW